MQTQFGLPTEVIKKIKKCIIYGSRAKGNFKPGSDIDLTLETPAMSLTELMTIESEIDDLLLPYKVDISLKHQISNLDLLEYISRVGIAF